MIKSSVAVIELQDDAPRTARVGSLYLLQPKIKWVYWSWKLQPYYTDSVKEIGLWTGFFKSLPHWLQNPKARHVISHSPSFDVLSYTSM